jgi:hypothetical protein
MFKKYFELAQEDDPILLLKWNNNWVEEHGEESILIIKLLLCLQLVINLCFVFV